MFSDWLKRAAFVQRNRDWSTSKGGNCAALPLAAARPITTGRSRL